VRTGEPPLTTTWWGIAKLKSPGGMRANHSHRNPAHKLLSAAGSFPSPLAIWNRANAIPDELGVKMCLIANLQKLSPSCKAMFQRARR
jgi:hypothetical protein